MRMCPCLDLHSAQSGFVQHFALGQHQRRPQRRAHQQSAHCDVGDRTLCCGFAFAAIVHTACMRHTGGAALWDHEASVVPESPVRASKQSNVRASMKF